VTRIAISLALLIFFPFSSLASVDQLTPSFEAESQTSLWTDDKDPSIETNRGRRVLKRSQRGKSSPNGLSKVAKPPSKIPLIGRLKQSPFVPHSSKSSVYQQINVYRI
jgi:hypothetical protein